MPIKYERPQGVRVKRASDGEEIPVELAFGGVDDEGCAQWIISTPVDVEHGDAILVDVFPPRCGITFGPKPVPEPFKEWPKEWNC